MLCKKNAFQKNVMYRNLTESFPQAFFFFRNNHDVSKSRYGGLWPDTK